MSNKIVPAIYRAVIDDVILNIKTDFDEFGVSEEILADLQHKWESKVIASRVADFEAPNPPPPQHHHAYPPHPMHMMPHPHYPPPHNPYGQPPHPAHTSHTHIKAETVEPRYVLGTPGMPPYALPALPGPQLNGARLPHPGGQQSVLSFPSGSTAAKQPSPIPPRLFQTPPSIPSPQQPQPHQQAPASQPPLPPPQPQPRIQQVDGPSSSESESPSPPPSQSSGPQSSLAQSSQTANSSALDDPEAINSDLDDSDTEGEEEAEEGGFAESDIVFCTYDKVARVKNKWKCILKDGMIHINGRDYLFAKCTGEFEW